MSETRILHRYTGASLYAADISDEQVAAERAARPRLTEDRARQRLTVVQAVGSRADLADADLAGADLAGAYLAGAYLAGAYLARADLADANLAGADLAGADLADADLAGAYLAGADLADANLAGAYLAGAYLARADLADANLADANLAGAYLAGAYLARADLADANLADANLAGPYRRAVTDEERKARRHARMLAYRERHPEVPVVEGLDAQILAAISQPGCSLDMGNWHTCETTHCRAGWAIHLAGEAGYALEAKTSPQRAGAAIYRASTGRAPHFFATQERALEDIQRCAAEGA